VRLLQATKERFVFELAKWEKHLLVTVLRLYPRIPPAHRLSNSSKLPDAEANQRLLEEALAEQRAENQEQLRALLADPQRLKETQTGWQLCLSRTDIEWLLQVLNDIRVGSWVLLGSPDEHPDIGSMTQETAPHFWALEMSGQFEMTLLRAVESASDS
jgi:hypothetical protein